MSRIRALAKESLVYGVSSLASRFLNFLLTPFYTHVLSTAEFGVNTMVFILIAFLNIVYQFGFDSAYLRLASDTDEAGRRRLFATAFQGQAVLAAGFTAVLLLAADPVAQLLAIPPEHAHLLRWAGAILVLDTLCVVPFAHLRLSHQALAFSGIRMVNVVVNVGMNLLLILRLGMGLDGVLLANIVASAVTFLLCSPLVFRHGRALLQGPALRQLLRFGLPLVPAGLFFIVIEAAGRIVLSRLSQAEIDRLHPGMGYDVQSLIGVFSAAWKLGIFGMLLVQMYRMAWQPFFLQRHKDADAPHLFGRVLLLLCLGVGYASVTLMVLLDWLVAVPVPVVGGPIIARPYWVGLPIVPWVLLAYACEAWVVHFNLGIHIAKDTRYFMWTNGVGALVAVSGNLLLVPRLGLIGAALSACLCYLSMAVLITRRSQRHFPIELNASVLLRVFVWLALGWTLGIAVQARPEDFPAAWRFVGLAVFWLLPLVLRAFPR
ncbi:MAG TPA: lipopolysaccharide biosynthesis protein [Fibrobacteria bacterium]|nr:lipopolysaccharide biosynthesis protein [Fibrobacteria bacterium]